MMVMMMVGWFDEVGSLDVPLSDCRPNEADVGSNKWNGTAGSGRSRRPGELFGATAVIVSGHCLQKSWQLSQLKIGSDATLDTRRLLSSYHVLTSSIIIQDGI